MKNRPKKKSPADIHRKAPEYDVEPMIAARKKIPEYTKIGEVWLVCCVCGGERSAKCVWCVLCGVCAVCVWCG
jgi:hypothetical protein